MSNKQKVKKIKSLFANKFVNEDSEIIQKSLVIAHQYYVSNEKYDDALKITNVISENLDKDGCFVLTAKNTNLNMETMNMDFSFYDFLANFDEKNIKETFKNNESWFGKNIPLEVIENMYKRSCKPVKKKMKPSFSFKVPIIKEKIQCQMYDQNRTCIDYHKLNEGIELVCILHLKGLKF